MKRITEKMKIYYYCRGKNTCYGNPYVKVIHGWSEKLGLFYGAKSALNASWCYGLTSHQFSCNENEKPLKWAVDYHITKKGNIIFDRVKELD